MGGGGGGGLTDFKYALFQTQFSQWYPVYVSKNFS